MFNNLRFLVLSAISLQASRAFANVLGWDQIRAFPSVSHNDAEDKAVFYHQPYLNVMNGCQATAAVDSEGNVSGGLEATGCASCGCDKTAAHQVYARSEAYGGQVGIMYAWYFPKDESSVLRIGGHRHDWEHCIVFVDRINPNQDPSTQKIASIACSAHGGYRKYNTPSADNFIGHSPHVQYFSQAGVRDHSLDLERGGRNGDMQPLIQWRYLTGAAQSTLNSYDFGSANCPINNNAFSGHIQTAYNAPA